MHRASAFLRKAGILAVMVKSSPSIRPLCRVLGLRWGPPAISVRHGPPDRPWIAFTFDDSRDAPESLAMLETIAACRIPATLFVTAQGLQENPQMAERAAAAGFEIGDHSRSHVDLATLSCTAISAEIGEGVRVYRELTRKPTSPLFRPPFGSKDLRVAFIAGSKGFRYMVLWDVDVKDWDGKSAESIEDQVMTRAHNGAIVLFHLWVRATREALPRMVEQLSARGFEFVTVTQMIEALGSFEGTQGGNAAVTS